MAYLVWFCSCIFQSFWHSLGNRELILVLFVNLFDLRLFGFVCFLFLLVSGKGCGLWLWHPLDFSLTFVFAVSLGYRDNVHEVWRKSFLTLFWRSLKGFPCWKLITRHFPKKCLLMFWFINDPFECLQYFLQITMYTISNATDHANEQKMILYTKYIDYTDMKWV